ncbi:MAG: endonuclease NucS [Candidatus Bathyarchaeota archaeon]|nr:endonuclease NucS [Candidatus Bathyarchaeota archaeon]
MATNKPFNVLVNPNSTEAEKAAREAVSKHKTLLIAGNCWVHYSGRAKSKLEPGERILIIKKDGSLLVHRSTGYEPVNWQPSGCIFHTRPKENVLEIHAVRQKQQESVRVFFDSIQLAAVLDLVDEGEFSLYVTEEDMQKAVLSKPALIEDGFQPISYEKKTEPGFVDVYGVDKAGKLVVVELKRKTASKDAAFQLSRYIDAVKARADREVRGILAAPSIGKDVQRVLATLGLEFKRLDPKRCGEALRKTDMKRLSEFFNET